MKPKTRSMRKRTLIVAVLTIFAGILFNVFYWSEMIQIVFALSFALLIIHLIELIGKQEQKKGVKE